MMVCRSWKVEEMHRRTQHKGVTSSARPSTMDSRVNLLRFRLGKTRVCCSSYGVLLDCFSHLMAGTSLARQIYGWFSLKRSSFDKGFHTYAIEWDDSFMRFYVDSRVSTILEVDIQGKGGKGFWDRGGWVFLIILCGVGGF